MKLLRFEADGRPVIGVVSGNGIVRISDLLPEFTEMRQLAAAGPEALARLKDKLATAQPKDALEGVKLLAPIERPGHFMALGMNYKKHAEEGMRLGVMPPRFQVWFNKATNCVSPPNVDIDPGVTKQLDYEVELGFVIGKAARYVSPEEAPAHIFGYFVANDVSARDWQLHANTWTVGKSFETFGPIGPWIVTPDEIGDPHKLELRCYVNGELRQKSNTSDMIYNIWEQIEYLSTAFELEPGDLYLTGTPEGVGHAMNPQTHLKPGDIVRCEIENIGAIENKVIESRAKRFPDLEESRIQKLFSSEQV
ncbi:fumarylacetoacetate hydrolase family protein [Sphingobium sp. 15-1]|uniref:fumarylacetoacetate hydrolase family protein n=1 Tax=Sphingobium sp. 15-1 TaxID=2729616 RepID=UPI00159C3D0C|nr:fumarylacetoacetate hydrolase family protein [Sphingobium sp. 15-1]